MYGFLRGLSTGVFLRGCAWMSVTDNNTENHEVVLRELSWLPGNKLARFSAAETLEPAPVNLENVTQKLHSMKTPPGKTQSRRVSQCNTERSPTWVGRTEGDGLAPPGSHIQKKSILFLCIIKAVFAVIVWNSGAKRQPSAKRERWFCERSPMEQRCEALTEREAREVILRGIDVTSTPPSLLLNLQPASSFYLRFLLHTSTQALTTLFFF